MGLGFRAQSLAHVGQQVRAQLGRKTPNVCSGGILLESTVGECVTSLDPI